MDIQTIIKLLKKENRNLLGAIGVLLGRKGKKGDEIGFEIKRTHYRIVRD